MPAALERHIRYPEGLLLTQGLVYAKDHMDDPAVFYNQEDLWVRSPEKHHDRVQPVEPYYVMWELPRSDQAEFVLMLPFTSERGASSRADERRRCQAVCDLEARKRLGDYCLANQATETSC